MSTAVQPEKILRELAELWVSLGKEQTSGVLRACAMTLIVGVDNAADALAAGETLAELMHEHPSRAIVLRLEERAEHKLDARVFAQCWMPFGGRQQICCEQIEITSSCDRLQGLAPVVLGITVPDLPVVFWCRSARLLELPAFQQLLPLARKIIVDSDALGAPFMALRRVRELGSQRRGVADLAWTRLTRWRELLANTFEEPGRSAELRRITRATIAHTGEMPSTAAFYLASWLRCALGAGIEVELRAAAGVSETDTIRAIELWAPAWKAEFQLSDGTAAVDVNGSSSKVVLGALSEYSLLREELSILENDAVFETALRAAVSMAGSYGQ